MGCLAALLLSRQPNLSIIVLEKREDHRLDGSSTRELRSINLAISARGRRALRAVGLEQEVIDCGVPMRGRAVHGSNGTTFSAYDDVHGKECIYSVSRREINDILLKHAEEKPNVKILFGKRVTRLERLKSSSHSVCVHLEKNEKIKARIVLGCDGCYSGVRDAMSRILAMDLNREYIEMGYMELSAPPNTSGSFRLEPHDALHIWPRQEESGMMLIALPNADGSFTATLFAPFETLLNMSSHQEYFEEFMHHHFSECMDQLLDGKHGDAHPLFTQNCKPWNCGSVALLLGDAAHNQVPFYGQGLNAGLEDALTLVEKLESTNFDWELAVPAYALSRQPCGVAITKLSLENYQEMHTQSASLAFRLRRRFQGMLAKWFGLSYPLYYAVSFTTEPYDKVLRNKRASEHWDQAVTLTALSLGLALVWMAKSPWQL